MSKKACFKGPRGDDKGYVTVIPLDANDWDQEPKSEKPEKPENEGFKTKKAWRGVTLEPQIRPFSPLLELFRGV